MQGQVQPLSDRKTAAVKSGSEKNPWPKGQRRVAVDLERVKARMGELGLNPTDVSRLGNLERTFVADLLAGRKGKIRKLFLEGLARGLNCDPRYLTGERDDIGAAPEGAALRPTRADAFLVLAGIIETGAFRTTTLTPEPVAMRPDPRHPGLRQDAYVIAGKDLLAAGMPPGAYVSVVALDDWLRRYGGLKSSQMVLVAVELEGIAGRELSLRRVEVFTDRLELRPVTPAQDVPPVTLTLAGEDDHGPRRVRIVGVATRTTLALE